jgi:hypothetical protein
MAPITTESLELVLSFLTLLPGFLTFKVFLYVSKSSRTYDKFETTTWSLLGSGASIGVVGLVAVGLSRFTNFLDVPTGAEITWDFVAALYPGLLVVAVVLGYVVGAGYNVVLERRGESRIHGSPWTVISKESVKPSTVRVVTTQGVEIEGYLAFTEPSESRDVVLRWPQRVGRGDDGEIVSEVPIGNYVYLPEATVSHVYLEGDLNRNRSNDEGSDSE